MGKLTAAQRDGVRKFLSCQGVTFKPLLEEMADHMSCDIEERMSEGFSFDEAWHQLTDEIPNNHFKNIQQQIMESITKRFNLSQGLSYMALVLLLTSTIFKMFHLQFGGYLMLLSFTCMATALLSNAIFGINVHHEKKGAVFVLGIVVGTVILMAGYSFKIMQLSGADGLILMAVIVIIASLFMNTLFVYQHPTDEGNLLTFLHAKYTPGIERFFLFLLIPFTIYKAFLSTDSIPNFVLLIVIFGAGLQLVALCLRALESNSANRNVLILTGIIICFLCLTLPFLGPMLSFEIRVIIIMVFSLVSAMVAYTLDAESNKVISLIMAIVVPVIFVGWGLIKLSVIPPSTANTFFNIPVLIVLVAGLFLCRKTSIIRTYMIISLSSYLFEYMA